jgi:Flp pilus assembly pilin Flp
MSKTSSILKNKKGQGMIEYMILVALIAIGTIGVVKVVGQNVSKQYENINRALGARKSQQLQLDNASDKQINRKDLSNFMDGSRNE